MNDELARRFPDMKSITAPPGLSTINGIGTTVVGRRDYDPETGTYVKTYVFCVLFIPIFTLAAYRVADAGQGWYFLGKVPLSRFARFWNSGVVLLIAGLAGCASIECQSITEAPSHADAPRSTAVKSMSDSVSTPAVAATAAVDAPSTRSFINATRTASSPCIGRKIPAPLFTR